MILDEKVFIYKLETVSFIDMGREWDLAPSDHANEVGIMDSMIGFP